MSKGISQKQWLNLVIIVVSALILAFVLIGRFVNVAVEQASERELERLNAPPLIIEMNTAQINHLEITAIDFGFYKVMLSVDGEWQLSPSAKKSDKTIQKIIHQWKTILSTPFVEKEWAANSAVEVRTTVLLYFKGVAQPLIIKLEAVSTENQKSGILMTFIASEKTIILENLSFDDLVLGKVALEKRAIDEEVLKDDASSSKSYPGESL